MKLRAERRLTGREMNAIFVDTEHGSVEVVMAPVGTFDCTPYQRWYLRYSYTAEVYAVDDGHVLVLESSETGGERPIHRSRVYHSADGGRSWREVSADEPLRQLDRYGALEPIASLTGLARTCPTSRSSTHPDAAGYDRRWPASRWWSRGSAPALESW